MAQADKSDDRLAQALAGFASPAADPVAAFARLFDWVRPRRGEDAAAAAVRYDRLLSWLEADPEAAARVRSQMLRLLRERRLVSFFADSGILPATGFFTELGRIVTQRLLPELPDDRELRGAMRQIFHRRGDWIWMQALPPELSRRFWRLVGDDAGALVPLLAPVLDQMAEALLVVAYRVGGLGIEEEFGRLGAEFPGYAPRFRGLTGAAQRFVDALRAHLQDPAAPFQDEAELLVMVDQCEEVIERARRASLRLGTSLHLTFLMRRTAQSLRRIDTLARLLAARFRFGEAQAPEAALIGWSQLVGEALRAESQRASIREHLSKGMALLALRVTDNAARTGEHYIAESRAEYFGMWRAAAGAGLIIGTMALAKILTAKLDLSLAGYGLFYSLNYGLGFVLIYMLHLTIATKQPAMTAQTIASYLGGVGQGAARLRGAELERVVDLIAAVARSQLAAIAGNVMVAFPTAIALFLLISHAKGAPIVDVGKAAHLLEDLNPLGWALPHAAVAGVFLYLSGLISGYFDNQASYAHIGERVARLRWLNAVAGSSRAARVGRYIEEHLGGLMGNFLFGCMLGTAGIVGIILGLPIDIRHIAFASANLGYAWAAFDFALEWKAFAWAAFGVALIGFVNLAVSFALALWTALKSRGIVFKQKRELLQRLWARLRLAPLSFVVAPGSA